MARFLILTSAMMVLWTTFVQGVSVYDGLRAANASLFANWIQSNPALAALYTSTSVQTIFAPTDEAFLAFNTSSDSTTLRRVMARQVSGGPSPAGLYQTDQISQNAGQFGQPGAVTKSNLKNSGGKPQAAVGHGKPGNGTKSKRDSTAPIWIFSGLGNNVSIVKTDTPYDGGLIQTVNGFFTLPESFNNTFSQTNTTSFSTGLVSAGLGSIIDNPAGVTVFSTTNEAFQAGISNTTNPTALSGILSNHIIPNFLGYTPALTNGAVLTTQAGTNVTVTIRNGVYFINNARVVASNQITTNGVAHVLDSIITVTSPPPPLFTGAATNGKSVDVFTMTMGALLMAFTSFFA